MALEATFAATQLAKVNTQMICDCQSTEFEVGMHSENGVNTIVLLQCTKCSKQILTRAVGDNLRKNLV